MSVKEINELFAGNLAGADDQIHPVYRYCSQRLKFANFPFVPSLNEVDWMTEPQKEITTIYGYTLFVILFGFAATLISYRIYIILMAIFNGSKKVSKFRSFKNFPWYDSVLIMFLFFLHRYRLKSKMLTSVRFMILRI